MTTPITDKHKFKLSVGSKDIGDEVVPAEVCAKMERALRLYGQAFDEARRKMSTADAMVFRAAWESARAALGVGEVKPVG